MDDILDRSNLLRMDAPEDELKAVSIGTKTGSEDSEGENDDNSSDDEDDEEEIAPPLVIQQVCRTIHRVEYIRLTCSKMPAAPVGSPIPTPL